MNTNQPQFESRAAGNSMVGTVVCGKQFEVVLTTPNGHTYTSDPTRIFDGESADEMTSAMLNVIGACLAAMANSGAPRSAMRSLENMRAEIHATL